MAGGVLASAVTLRGEGHRLVTFPVGSTPPVWAQALISNPKAWEPSHDTSASTPEADPGSAEEPPRAGRGSSRAAWATHAEALGVSVASDVSRDDIIAAVDAHQN